MGSSTGAVTVPQNAEFVHVDCKMFLEQPIGVAIISLTVQTSRRTIVPNILPGCSWHVQNFRRTTVASREGFGITQQRFATQMLCAGHTPYTLSLRKDAEHETDLKAHRYTIEVALVDLN